jgi:hypothetical protein
MMGILRRSPLVGLALAAAACGGGRDAAVSPTPNPPAASPELLRLRPGLVLSLVPNLPGVPAEDVPEASRLDVQILEADGRQLRIRWTGTVRVETPESARRREDWVRATSNAPAGATPLPAVPPAYERREISGTLLFPDENGAPAFLLPGLWPEGTATFPGASGLAMPRGAFALLKRRGEADVPLFLTGRGLREPASLLLRRASEKARAAQVEGSEIWRRIPPPRRVPLRVDGQAVEVRAITAKNWFGTFEVLDDAENPLVLSVLPSPSPSPALDLFKPAKVLKALLGYRVAEAARTPAEAKR